MGVYAKGDRVAQPNYGAGTIIDADPRYTIIDFDQHGRRTFLTAVVALVPTSEPAPSRKTKAPGRRPPRS
jgi:hypothetical protein